jgi:hypothetical protein
VTTQRNRALRRASRDGTIDLVVFMLAGFALLLFAIAMGE